MPYQYPTAPDSSTFLIDPDRFPRNGYAKSGGNEWGDHLAGAGIPGAETVPGVVNVFRRGPTGNGVEFVMTDVDPNGDAHEVLGDLPPNYMVRLA